MDLEKFAKVLALAGSSNDMEALAALRRARQMLAADDMDFIDVVDSLVSIPTGDAEVIEELEATILELRGEIRDLKSENRRLRRDAAAPASARTSPTNAGTVARLRAELASVDETLSAREAERDRLRVVAANERKRADAAEATQAQLNDLLGELEGQLRMQGARAAGLQREVERLRLEGYRLTAELRRLSAGGGPEPEPGAPRKRGFRRLFGG